MVGAGSLPEGTVTVLSADLLDSTGLNQRLGDDAANAVERGIELALVDLLDSHRGVLVGMPATG